MKELYNWYRMVPNLRQEQSSNTFELKNCIMIFNFDDSFTIWKFYNNAYLKTQKSLGTSGVMPLAANWKISVFASSRASTRDLARLGSHMNWSRKMRLRTSAGGASTSVVARHTRSGCPSPTFLYANSTCEQTKRKMQLIKMI